MPVTGPGVYKLRVLSAKLRDAGSEGQGLRRELFKAVSAAAKPLVKEISSEAHLNPYMPDRYAAVLATDITVSAQKSAGRDPGVAIRAKGRRHARKVKRLNDLGILSHPVYGNRRNWADQTSHVRPGFFTDACKGAAPEIRDQVLGAMHEIGKRLTSL